MKLRLRTEIERARPEASARGPRASTARSTSSRSRASARSTPSAPTSSASDRSRRASTRSSRAPRRRRRRRSPRRSRAGSRGHSPTRRRGPPDPRRRRAGSAAGAAAKPRCRTLGEHRDFPDALAARPFDRDGASTRSWTRLSAARGAGRAELAARRLPRPAISPRSLASSKRRPGRRRSGGATTTGSRRSSAVSHALEQGWTWKGAPRPTFGARLAGRGAGPPRPGQGGARRVPRGGDADLAPLLHGALQAPSRLRALEGQGGPARFPRPPHQGARSLRDDGGVRASCSSASAHLFVDEFQDTDPLQAEILLLLAADDPGRDELARCPTPSAASSSWSAIPKQSIYRFRRADVALYEEVKERLLSGRGAELLHLSTSFRAPPSIQAVVNAAFALAMAAGSEGSQAAYVPLAPSTARDRRPADRRRVCRCRGRTATTARSPHRRDRTSRSRTRWRGFVAWLVNESGWTVEDEGKRGRRPAATRRDPVPPVPELRHRRHAALRARARGAADPPRARRRALLPRARGGHRAAQRAHRDRVARRRAQGLRHAARAVLRARRRRAPRLPQQSKAQATSTDPPPPSDARGRPQLTLDPAAVAVADALEVLGRLHVGRNRPADRRHDRSAPREHARPRRRRDLAAGEQALANCQRLLDMARHFERGASSFRAFVERLEATPSAARPTRRRSSRKAPTACAS